MRRSSSGPVPGHDIFETAVDFCDLVPLERIGAARRNRTPPRPRSRSRRPPARAVVRRPTTWARNQRRREASSEPVGDAESRGSSSGAPPSIAAIRARASATSLGGPAGRFGSDAGGYIGWPVVGVHQAVYVATSREAELDVVAHHRTRGADSHLATLISRTLYLRSRVSRAGRPGTRSCGSKQSQQHRRRRPRASCR